MLYFLYQLADADLSAIALEMSASRQSMPPGSLPSPEAKLQSPGPSPKRYSERQFVVDSPAFNEAFSKPGLLKLPLTEEAKAGRLQSAEKPERLSRVREKRAAEAAKPEETVPQTAPEPRTYGPMEPSEPSLLRDLPFTLQGLSSTNLAFESSATLKLPPTLPVPLISLLHTLAEPSLLYRGLSEFVESTEGGLVGQSFRSALGKELRAYLGLVATLEGQIRRAMVSLDESAPKHGIGKAGVTLKRCVIWTRDATIGLRLMKLLVEESTGRSFVVS
jgi:gamma-tubulin complex component 3